MNNKRYLPQRKASMVASIGDLDGSLAASVKPAIQMVTAKGTKLVCIGREPASDDEHSQAYHVLEKCDSQRIIRHELPIKGIDFLPDGRVAVSSIIKSTSYNPGDKGYQEYLARMRRAGL